MKINMYASVSNLAVSFAYFLIGPNLFFLRFIYLLLRWLHLEYLSSDEFSESNEEQSDKLGSKSGLAGMFSTLLGGFLCGVRLPYGVTVFADDSCDRDGGSIFL